MYWSDWGNHPKIETAAMDGTLRETLVQDNIQWPTGEQRRVPGGSQGVAKTLTGGTYNPLVLGQLGLGALSPVAGVCGGGCAAGHVVRRGSGWAGGPYLTRGCVPLQAWLWTTTTSGCTGPTPSSPSSAASGSTALTLSWPLTTRRVSSTQDPPGRQGGEGPAWG